MELERNRLLEIIKTDKTIKKRLSFREHLKLYNTALKLSNEDINNLIHEVTPPRTNPKAVAILKNGLAIASLAIPVPGLMLAVGYLADINRYKCATRVEKEGGENKIVGFAQCRYASAKWSENYVKGEINKCKGTKNPGKCQKKMFKLLKSVTKSRVESEGKLRWAMAKARERQRRNG